MRRDQALAQLPQIAARIEHYTQKVKQAEKTGDMTAWDDAQRNIRKLQRERTNLIQQYH